MLYIWNKLICVSLITLIQYFKWVYQTGHCQFGQVNIILSKKHEIKGSFDMSDFSEKTFSESI